MLQKQIYIVVSLFIISACIVSCKTISNNNSTLEDLEKLERYDIGNLIKIAVEKGDTYLIKAKEIIIKKGERQQAQEILEHTFHKYLHIWNKDYVTNAVLLYKEIALSCDTKLIRKFALAPSSYVRQFAWVLAAHFPSDQIKETIDDIVSEYVRKNAENQIISPYLAIAVEKNRVESLYTIMKDSLLKLHDEAFARAMIALNPKEASKDFLDYLSLASIEDLRQLNQKSINVYTAMLILQHQMKYAPPAYLPKFNVLILYSVSRNKVLSDLALNIIESLIAVQKEQIAYQISQMPIWIQVAFIENVNRRMNLAYMSLLKTLQQITPHKEVLAELKDIN